MNHNSPTSETLDFVESTDSTNTALRNRLQQSVLEENHCLYTDFQTQGRGQQGNYWESEQGKNLLFSILLRPSFLSPINQFLVSKAIAVAVTKTLNQYHKGFSIKWPNDIYFGEQKIAGILIENEWMGNNIEQSIIGIGLNVNQKQFKSNAPNPTSLFSILNKEIDKIQLLSHIREAIQEQYALLKKKKQTQINRNYHQLLYRKEGYFTYQDSTGLFEARLIKVDHSGKLFLETSEKEIRSYYFKEVSFIHTTPQIEPSI